MELHSEFAKRVMWHLRSVDKHASCASSMLCTTLPLNTELVFEGIPLASLLIPKTEGCAREIESIFDTWCCAISDGEDYLGAISALKEIERDEVAGFVKRTASNLAEATTALLICLGNADGAKIECTETSAVITHDTIVYGIVGNIATSRFSTGMRIEMANPLAVLGGTREIRVRDSGFVAYYREAYRVGNGCVEALIAMYMSMPEFNFKRELARKKHPSEEKLSEFENLLMHRRDPLSSLFTKLVPKWLTVTEFQREIARLENRSLNPGPRLRSRYVQRMYELFNNHKKNKEIAA